MKSQQNLIELVTRPGHFQRFTVVLEYEEKPVVPAPLTFLCHAHRTLRYLYRACKGRLHFYRTGLKLFLNKTDLERLYDFEEECAEGLMEQKEREAAKTETAMIRNLQVWSQNAFSFLLQFI